MFLLVISIAIACSFCLSLAKVEKKLENSYKRQPAFAASDFHFTHTHTAKPANDRQTAILLSTFQCPANWRNGHPDINSSNGSYNFALYILSYHNTLLTSLTALHSKDIHCFFISTSHALMYDCS